MLKNYIMEFEGLQFGYRYEMLKCADNETAKKITAKECKKLQIRTGDSTIAYGVSIMKRI